MALRFTFLVVLVIAIVLASHTNSRAQATSTVMCDGTDKTDALQTALNTGGLIYLVPSPQNTQGVCLVSHTLLMSEDSTVIVGEGGGFYGESAAESAKTILRWNTTTAPPPTPSFSPFPTPTPSPTLPPAPAASPTYGTTLLEVSGVRGGGIYNVAFSSNGGALSYGLWLNGSHGLTYQNLSFDAFNKVALMVGGPSNISSNNVFRTLSIDNEVNGSSGNSGTGIMVGHPSANTVSYNEFHDMFIWSTTGYGIYINNSTANFFYDVSSSIGPGTRYGPQWSLVFGCGTVAAKFDWFSPYFYSMPAPNPSIVHSVYVAGANDCGGVGAQYSAIAWYDEDDNGGAPPTLGQGSPTAWFCHDLGGNEC